MYYSNNSLLLNIFYLIDKNCEIIFRKEIIYEIGKKNKII